MNSKLWQCYGILGLAEESLARDGLLWNLNGESVLLIYQNSNETIHQCLSTARKIHGNLCLAPLPFTVMIVDSMSFV